MAKNTDLKKFERASPILGLGNNTLLSTSLTTYALSTLIAGDGCDPDLVPFYALEKMSTHPAIYLAERTVSSIIQRPNLYTVVHNDPKIIKEVEAWLWPLFPTLLKAYVRAFAYGSAPVILNWGTKTLRAEVEGRKKTFKNHTHYTSAHVIRPSEVTIEHQNDVLEAVLFEGNRYLADRARVIVWDGEWGSFRGQSARRRAWRDYASSLAIESLEAAYLERSVDSPRIGYAPPGSEEFEGVSQDGIQYMVQQIMSSRGSGAMVFPNDRDENGELLYDVKLLDVPDREGIWERAINRRDKRMSEAYLAVGGGDSAAQARTVEGLLKELIQSLAEWVAQDLTLIVECVHAVNHPESKLAPEIVATDVGKQNAMKMLAEITKVASVEVAKWVDVPAALDKLSVPVLDEPLEPELLPTAPQTGGDVSSQREERREDARTEPGSEDTGQEKREELSKPRRRRSRFKNLEHEEKQPIIVNIAPPIVNVPAPVVHVAAPEVRVAAPIVNVAPAKVEVTVAPDLNPPKRQTEILRDANGFVIGAKEV